MRNRRGLDLYRGGVTRDADVPADGSGREAGPIEVFHDGAWRPAEILGRRTAEDGGGHVLVRFGVESHRTTTWKDAQLLRSSTAPRPHETRRGDAFTDGSYPRGILRRRSGRYSAVTAEEDQATMRLPLAVAVPPPAVRIAARR